jgi:hypothetical protein
MLTQREFARLIDGPALDREIDRLTRKGGSWILAAQILSRRVNGTVDWAPLGPAGSRYSILGSRGEAVLFWDNQIKDRIIKLRGREENGFGTAGFGCILVRNERGMIEYGPGTIEEALERERLSWEHLGFSSRFDDLIGDDAGLLLVQDFIAGTAPTEKEIRAWMIERGWETLEDAREVAVSLRQHAWHRDGIGAFDANETNFVKSEADGEIYPVDLIVWRMPQ